MKRIIGYILIICGVFSLPHFFLNLSNVHDSYEFIGMFLGQGLIFFLAYLCLQSKKQSPEDNSGSIHVDKNEESLIINIDEDISNSLDYPKSYFIDKAKGMTDSYVIEKAELQIEEKEQKQGSCKAISFPEIDINSVSWDEIERLLFTSQKEELLLKCNPANFMNPYSHDKIELANRLIIMINNATNLDDFGKIKLEASKIGIYLSGNQLYSYLSEICNPLNFVGKNEEFKLANNLYNQILVTKDNFDKLCVLYEEAKNNILLSSSKKLDCNSVNRSRKTKNKIIVIMSLFRVRQLNCVIVSEFFSS